MNGQRRLFTDPEMACFGVDLTLFITLSLEEEGEGIKKRGEVPLRRPLWYLLIKERGKRDFRKERHLEYYVIARSVSDETIPIVYEIARPLSGKARNDRRRSNDQKETYVSSII